MAVDLTTAAKVLGKAGRSRNTASQAKASRENGKKGGRPIIHGRRSKKLKARKSKEPV